MQRIYRTFDFDTANRLATLLAGGNVVTETGNGFTTYAVFCFTTVPSDLIRPAIASLYSK